MCIFHIHAEITGTAHGFILVSSSEITFNIGVLFICDLQMDFFVSIAVSIFSPTFFLLPLESFFPFADSSLVMICYS